MSTTIDLIRKPATASNSGELTDQAQTIAGAKTFSDTATGTSITKFASAGLASATEPGILSTGAQTIAGAKTFTGVMAFTGQPTAAAYSSTSQSGIVSGTVTKVQFGVEEFDVGSFYDHVTNYRIQPTTPGKYLITWQVSMYGSVSNATRGGGSEIRKSGVSFKIGAQLNHGSTAFTDRWSSGGSCVVDANGSTDFFEIFASLAVTSGTAVFEGGQAATWVSIAKIA